MMEGLGITDIMMFVLATIVGLGVSAPLGPVALLALRRGLSGDGPGAAVTGCGAGLADILIVSLTLMAASTLSTIIESHRGMLMIAGGLVLVTLGIIGARSDVAPIGSAPSDRPQRLLKRLRFALEGFGIAMTNPGNIAAISAVALSMLVRPVPSQPDGAALLGFFLGSQTWWIGVGFGSARLGGQLAGRWVRRASVVLSLIIGLIGVVMVGWAITDLLQKVQ